MQTVRSESAICSLSHSRTLDQLLVELRFPGSPAFLLLAVRNIGRSPPLASSCVVLNKAIVSSDLSPSTEGLHPPGTPHLHSPHLPLPPGGTRGGSAVIKKAQLFKQSEATGGGWLEGYISIFAL